MSDVAREMTDQPQIRSGPAAALPSVLFCAAANVLLFPAFDWFDPSGLDAHIRLLLVLAGILSGQACWVAVVAALACRTWIGGYYWGLACSAAGFAGVMLGAWWSEEFERGAWAALCWIPGLLLASTLPLQLFRQFRGWRLAARGASLPAPQPAGLADLLSFTAITAAALVLLRAPQIIWEVNSGEYWPPLLITSGVLFGVGLLVLPPTVRLFFATQRRVAAWTGLLLFPCLAAVALDAVVEILEPSARSWSQRWDALLFLTAFLSPLFGVYYVLLWLLAWRGLVFRTGRFSAAVAATGGTVERAETTSGQRAWRMAGAIGVAVAASMALARLEQWRREQDALITELQDVATQLDGELSASERRVVHLKLGGRAADGDLGRFSTCRDLEHLDLSGSRVTDAGLNDLRQFPRLQALLANQTSITDLGLRSLAGLDALLTLDLNGTRITGAGLDACPLRLTWLSAEHTPFDDHGCEQLARLLKLEVVSLRGTRVTDEGMSHLARLPRLGQLDLSETGITGRSLKPFAALEVLRLERAPVDDPGLAVIARLPRLSSLNLSQTSVTDVSLAHLRECRRLGSLNLRGTRISDAGIAALKDCPIISIDLSGTPVTGEAFAEWMPQPRAAFLLAGTGITDETLTHLKPLTPLKYLSLADTQVTDAGLKHLASMPIDTLNLCGTQVTAAGILQAGLAVNLTFAHGQFPAAETMQLRQRYGRKIEFVDPEVESSKEKEMGR